MRTGLIAGLPGPAGTRQSDPPPVQAIVGAAPWMAVNMQARMLHAPHVRSFEGFDRPWNHLEQLLDDVHVRELAFGSGYVLTGRSSGPGGLTLGSYSARPDRGPPNPAQVATFKEDDMPGGKVSGCSTDSGHGTA